MVIWRHGAMRTGHAPSRQNDYQVCAQVVYLAPDAWAVDFGLAAFQELQPPEFVQIRPWVEG